MNEIQTRITNDESDPMTFADKGNQSTSAIANPSSTRVHQHGALFGLGQLTMNMSKGQRRNEEDVRKTAKELGIKLGKDQLRKLAKEVGKNKDEKGKDGKSSFWASHAARYVIRVA
jgi:hypothetical protein